MPTATCISPIVFLFECECAGPIHGTNWSICLRQQYGGGAISVCLLASFCSLDWKKQRRTEAEGEEAGTWSAKGAHHLAWLLRCVGLAGWRSLSLSLFVCGGLSNCDGCSLKWVTGAKKHLNTSSLGSFSAFQTPFSLIHGTCIFSPQKKKQLERDFPLEKKPKTHTSRRKTTCDPLSITC